MRYDGFDFQTFQRMDTTGVNKVTAIFKDEAAILWVGYEDGAIFHLNQHDILMPWEPEEGLPKVAISGFAQDEAGRIWFATYGEGLYYWDGRRMYNFGAEEGLTGLDIYVLAKDNSGRMWVGTDGGISICWLEDGKKKVKTLGREEGLPDEIVRYILPDSEGNCWVGTYEQGFCQINETTMEVSFPLKNWHHGVIKSMELIEDRELWIGTESNGVWQFDLKEKSIKQLKYQALSTAKIFDLHMDWEGNMWVLSNQEGLLSTNCHFAFIQNDLENLQAIRMDGRNRLWVGVQTGLYLFESDSLGDGIFKMILPDNVLSLFEDAYGNIWVGTFGNGVILLDPNLNQQRRISEQNGLPNGSILSIDGTSNHIWLATLGGVVELDLSHNPMHYPASVIRQLDYETELGTNFIYKVFVDQKQRTWFGTDGQGISVLENGQLKRYLEADSVPIKSVYSITEDAQGHIWFSTVRNGVYGFDGQNFRHLGYKEGLRDLNISGLVTDKNGKILILHPRGIDHFDPTTNHLIYFGREAGVEHIDPNLNTYSFDNRGDIWIGTDKGIIRYAALSSDLSIHPANILKSVSVNFKSLQKGALPRLKYNENNLAFEYVGLWYTDPGSVRYRYKLEGYNHDWIISKDNQAVYPNLPHGEYTFMVSSTENGRFHNEPIIQYAFHISPPIWLQTWFIILFILLFVGLIYLFIRTREKRMQREAALVKEKLESQFETLKSQINPHFLFNNFNTLITIIEENPSLAVEYVEKLADFYRSILQYREKELIPLEEELKMVEDYTFLLKKRFGNNLHVAIEKGEQGSYIVPLTLQMLLENAVKHNIISKQQPLEIAIYPENGSYITIRNHLQRKIVAEPSTGFGLDSIIKRYGLLTAKKVLIGEADNEFKVSIPIMNNSKL